MGTALTTLQGYSLGNEGNEVSSMKSNAIPSLSSCPLHPGQLAQRAWLCKVRQSGKKKQRTKGVLHAFSLSLCYHPHHHAPSALVIDLSGIHNVGRAIKKGKPVIFLLTPMGKYYIEGMTVLDREDCLRTLTTLRASISPVPKGSRVSTSPVYEGPTAPAVAHPGAVAKIEGEFGMVAHHELPDSMASLFLQAKESPDNALGSLSQGPKTMAVPPCHKAEILLPASLASFWKAFSSKKWKDWPCEFHPAGRWKAVDVGEWVETEGCLSRRVSFVAKLPKRSQALQDGIISEQRACLMVDRKSLATRIHIAVVNTINGQEYPRAREWFELVNISRDKGFPMLQILDYRWHEDAPAV